MQDAPTSIMIKYLQVFLHMDHIRNKVTMQVLGNISTKNNRTVVVPVPKALLQPHVWQGSAQDKDRLLQDTVNTAVPLIRELCA